MKIPRAAMAPVKERKRKDFMTIRSEMCILILCAYALWIKLFRERKFCNDLFSEF
jgi:hypothetical protein